MVMLCDILQALNITDADTAEAKISGITADSREVKEGWIFFAIPGHKTDGSQYIQDALTKGAIAVIKQKPETRSQKPEGLIFEVPSVRLALSKTASLFYPQQPKFIAAVTGTDGKTSTINFLNQLLHLAGLNSASIGTLGVSAQIKSADKGGITLHDATTPDPVSLHRTLRELAKNGITHVAMEASSHGLHQHRLDCVILSAAGFTTFSQDHLDYHHTMQEYLDSKLRLFSEVLPPGKTAVVNADDAACEAVLNVCRMRGHQVYTYGRNGREIRIMNINYASSGLVAEVAVAFPGMRAREEKIYLPLAGDFQLWNALCAFGLGIAAGLNIDLLLELLPRLQAVRGRLEKVGDYNRLHSKLAAVSKMREASIAKTQVYTEVHADLRSIATSEFASAVEFGEKSNSGTVYVDYAHTPAALGRAIESLRRHTNGKLHVLFGCGGDRDPSKRPLMGAIAAEKADTVIVTDDNPRSENPADIRAQIIATCPNATEISDRREAIAHALRAMGHGDILLIAGKGHETYQIIGSTRHHFDDSEEVRKLLAL